MASIDVSKTPHLIGNSTAEDSEVHLASSSFPVVTPHSLPLICNNPLISLSHTIGLTRYKLQYFHNAIHFSRIL